MMKALKKIGCLLLVVLLAVSCKTQTKQPQKLQRDIATNNSNAALSDSLGKALAEFNRGAALLEQYKYAEAARAFEAVLEIVPDPAHRSPSSVQWIRAVAETFQNL